MTTAALTNKSHSNNTPGYFNYTQYHQGVKKSYPLVRLRPNEITAAEEIIFAELVEEAYPLVKEKPVVKGDLPLSSDFGNVNPLWLLFARNGLKKLQYR